MTQNDPPTKPPAFGGLLFRTLGNDEETNQPLAFGEESSPFNSVPNGNGVALTVADVLPQLPPDLARATSVPQDQPVQISPSILNQALSSGHLAIPLFEVYRVCPGIFLSPVSPDDTRTVRLPPSKLSSLVTLAASAPAPTQMPAIPTGTSLPPSPFAAQSPLPQAPASPFSTSPGVSPFASLLSGTATPPPSNAAPSGEARPGATLLPPRRDPSQPPTTSIPPAPPFQVVSPFSSEPMPSPFGTPEASAPPANQPPSPFPSQSVSPFAVAAPMPSEAPAPLPSFFSAVEESAPAAFAPQPAAPAQASPSQSASVPALTGPATAPVSALLKGQHPDDLGFDPAMVPSWINTQLHGGLVADLQAMSEPKIELGAIVDGITDIGFRNVLHSAQRNHLIPISLSTLAPSQPAPSAFSPAQPPPLRVEPPAPVAVAQPPAAFQEPPVPTLRVEPGNPFSQVPEAPVPFSPPAPAPAPAPVADANPFIQPISFGLEQFTSAIASSPTPPPTQTPPPVEPTPPAAPPAFTSFVSALDPFAPSDEPSQRPSGDQTGFTSFDLMGGSPVADSAPPSLFPDSPEPAPLFQTEVPEIPAPVDPPTVQPAPPQPSPSAPSWASLSSEEPVLPNLPEEKTESPTSELPQTFLLEPESAVPPAPQESFVPTAEPPPTAPMLSATAPHRSTAASKPSMGLSAVSTGAEEQLMLRALLGTDEELTIARVMELTVGLPGITACALIKGEQVLAGESTKGSDARAFRAQAAEVARSLRTLAPLIGIADAETFTLNTDSRLITLCFPGTVTLGILHDREPSLGLRDKLTLIARQLAHMVG